MFGGHLPARVAGAVFGGALALAATGAQAEISHDGDTVTIHESVVVQGSAQAIWAQYGGYCDITQWIAPVLSCEYVSGEGRLGTVRKLALGGGLGEVIEVMAVEGPTLYTYEMTEGFAAHAKYRSTVWTVPGATADTAEIHWRTTILASAYEDGGVGLSQALKGVYAASLADLKAMVEF